jgi:predicted dehydrogenase
MEQAEIVIIGGAWRSEFFLRVAKACPEMFRVGGMLIRDAAKGAAIEKEWGVRTYRNLDELLGVTKPLYAIVSIPRKAAPGVLAELTERRMPALCETPPADDIAGLAEVNELTKRSGRIQVAEQYIFQPLHGARMAVIEAGLLGTVTQAQVSVAHGYHGVSLIRRFLGVRNEPVKITAHRFVTPIVKGPDRFGPPKEEKIAPSKQPIAWLDFGERFGVFDFEGEYRSYIRSQRILVRGERGEINFSRVRHLVDHRTPMEFELEKLFTGRIGGQDGYCHDGVVGGGRYWWRNPFAMVSMGDDDIAVGTCMIKMAEYARGGESFYSLAEGSHDHYLGIMMDKAADSGQTIEVLPQPWATW